jgi:glycosyltransferase involved in cell wall biosynthesis
LERHLATEKTMRLLLLNLATDVDNPTQGFNTRWIWALAKRVEFIHVVTMRIGRVEVPGNVRVYSVGKEKGFSEPRRAIEFYRILFGILRDDRVDVCFSHMAQIFTVLAAPVLKLKRIPIVTWYAHPSLTWDLKLAHHLSDQMIASVATAYPYKRDKLLAIGQGIDTDLFAPNGGESPEGPPIILCVGRVSPAKNHSTLLKAALLLRQRLGKTFRVVIVGGAATPRDGSYIESLHRQIKEQGLQDIVYFEPPTSLENLPSWYRRCTIHVNLTPTGFGDKVAWEAMACCKPCLVANEGFRETLGKHSEQLTFRYGDAGDLARALEWALSLSETERQCIGVYLREQVLRMHSLDGLASKLVDLFDQCVEKKSPRPARRVGGEITRQL